MSGFESNSPDNLSRTPLFGGSDPFNSPQHIAHLTSRIQVAFYKGYKTADYATARTTILNILAENSALELPVSNYPGDLKRIVAIFPTIDGALTHVSTISILYQDQVFPSLNHWLFLNMVPGLGAAHLAVHPHGNTSLDEGINGFANKVEFQNYHAYTAIKRVSCPPPCPPCPPYPCPPAPCPPEPCWYPYPMPYPVPWPNPWCPPRCHHKGRCCCPTAQCPDKCRRKQECCCYK